MFLFTVTIGKAENLRGAIQVELNSEKSLRLHVSLRSGIDTRTTCYKSRLPWGSVHSLILIAVTRSGHLLDKKLLPIDDPSPDRVTLEPDELLSGEIDLQKYFKDLRSSLQKSDIQLFWAYEAPEELRIPRWSGGWILIKQDK
jgi:hypothetical protein